MPMPTLQQIIGTITGKVAFERAQANFTTIKTAHDGLDTSLTTHKADMVTQLALKATKGIISTHYLVLQNGFTGNGTAEKDDTGKIILSGLVIPGATLTKGTVIGTLPTGYRPKFHVPITFIQDNVLYDGAVINRDTGSIVLNNAITGGYGLYFTVVYNYA